MDTTESKDIKVLTMRERLELCAPFNLFFTTIPEEPKTTGYNCIAFPGILYLYLRCTLILLIIYI